jgi:hypothetical protein
MNYNVIYCLYTIQYTYLNIVFFRFAYFVMKQPGKVDYSDEGGPTPSCGPSMADGRGPKRYQN